MGFENNVKDLEDAQPGHPLSKRQSFWILKLVAVIAAIAFIGYLVKQIKGIL